MLSSIDISILIGVQSSTHSYYTIMKYFLQNLRKWNSLLGNISNLAADRSRIIQVGELFELANYYTKTKLGNYMVSGQTATSV